MIKHLIYMSLALLMSVTAFAVDNASDESALASYELRGTTTNLWDGDVDYYARPITLIRTRNTFDVHTLYFNIARYVVQCVAYQNYCVRYDNYGRCVAYERRCVREDYRVYPIERRIELNFRDMPDLAEGQTEKYEIQIDRQRPAGREGDDWVRTWFRPLQTQVPATVRRWSDYRYSVTPAPMPTPTPAP